MPQDTLAIDIFDAIWDLNNRPSLTLNCQALEKAISPASVDDSEKYARARTKNTSDQFIRRYWTIK